MEEIQINAENYIPYGLGDIYYGLISFISSYVNQNYNPMEVFQNDNSRYAVAISTMKESLKELLDYLKVNDEIYIPSLNRNIKISTLTSNEQLALEERCKEYLVAKLNYVFSNEMETPVSNKTR